MIERDRGDIKIICDVCGLVRETGTDEWDVAWQTAKRDGWKAEKVGKDWLHACEDCDTRG
jgi:hypothetical protein